MTRKRKRINVATTKIGNVRSWRNQIRRKSTVTTVTHPNQGKETTKAEEPKLVMSPKQRGIARGTAKTAWDNFAPAKPDLEDANLAATQETVSTATTKDGKVTVEDNLSTEAR